LCRACGPYYTEGRLVSLSTTERGHDRKLLGRSGMKKLAAILLCLCVLVGLTAVAQEQEKYKEKLVFKSKMGNVTFDHAKHQERAQKCETCHDKLFPKTEEPLGFGKGMHKPAEAAKTSCAACHVDGGTAFQTKGNCNKCHVKAAAK